MSHLMWVGVAPVSFLCDQLSNEYGLQCFEYRNKLDDILIENEVDRLSVFYHEPVQTGIKPFLP
jgi:hypothetical protein